MNRRLICFLFLLFYTLCGTLSPSRAQLATSFYSVTALETKILPNAVQITIRTDGVVKFGGDLSDWVDIGVDKYDPKRISSLRLRLLRARARLPAFIDIGAYPVDNARVTLGREAFARPFFPGDSYDQPEPRVDIELRFFVPVLVRRFIVERFEGYDNSVNFGDYLAPLEVRVEPGADKSSIVITVITDRADVRSAAQLKRSPPENWQHRLNVQMLPGGRARFDVLHQPLDELLDAASRAFGLSLSARGESGAIDVSLSLPDAGAVELLRALKIGYGLSVEHEADDASGTRWTLGRGGSSVESERLPLQHLSPSRARLLLPDFLLSLLRADDENNALVATGPRVLIERVRRDLAVLDRPRVLLRVEASVYEIARNDDWNFAFDLAYGGASGENATTGVALDRAGQIALRVDAGTSPIVRVQLEALRSRGRARLRARPFVTVVSGESGTLFLGQTRFVPVLRQVSGRQDVQALPLSVGYSLTVRPVAGKSGETLIEISPRLSTVDEIERGSGLPTLGIREMTSALRVRDGDEIVVAGLDSLIEGRNRSRPLAGRRDNRSDTKLIVLVSARRV